MGKVLIIGAGGVGTVVAHKVAQNPDVFTEIMIASRTKSKCDAVVKAIGNPNIKTAQVDADNVDELVALFNSFKPEIVINVALPYQDLTIMEACLKTGVNYLDTANYEPKDVAHFEYSWQWAYKQRFEEAGLTAILGCGFDPGVSGVYTAYAAKHHFDEIQYLDIVDCNAGNHHKAFATNFNPEINIREITQNGRYYENGQWVTTKPLEIHKDLTYPNIGPRDSYLLYHEELESLVKNFPTRSGLQRRKNRPLAIPEGRTPQPTRLGRELRRRDFHRLPHPRIEGWQGAHLLRLQQLQPPSRLQGNRYAGCQLHHGRTSHDWRHDVPQRHLEEARRMERRRIRPRSIHGAAQQARPALARSN